MTRKEWLTLSCLPDIINKSGTKEKVVALLTDELVARAKAVKSAAELLALAKKNDFLMSEEEAEVYFAMLQASANE